MGCLLTRSGLYLNSDKTTRSGAIDMEDLKKDLESKILRLRELVNARSKAYCTSVNSSADEVRRETEIDDLEQAIKKLEAKLGKAQAK